MAAPKVSILIAAYSPRYLQAALQSTSAQTLQDFEIVVRDDCPTNAVALIVEAFARTSAAPLNYQRNESRLGVRRNYERCFAAAQGEYVKFLNDDDLLDPACIEQLARALDGNPAAHLATSHRRCIDDCGSPLRDIPATQPVVPFDCLIDGSTVINALLLLGLNFIGEPSTAMFRRSAIGDGPLFDFLGDPGRGVSDLVLWCRLAQAGPVVFLKSRLSSFRMHGQQRQAIPGVQSLAAASIPAMRDKWLALDRHLDCPPNVLQVLPLPAATGSQPARDPRWQYIPVPIFVVPGSDVQQLVSDWRAKRHPFFSAQRDSAP